LNYRNIGLVLLIPSTLIGIIVLGMNSYLPNGLELPIPILYFSIINGTIWIIGIVLVNYKAKHSGRESTKFRRTNTKPANDI
jgi:hypothetical protein